MVSTVVNYDDYWSEEGKVRRPGRLQAVILGAHGVPGMIGMHGGLPPAAAFPITNMTVGVQCPPDEGSNLEIAGALVTTAQQYNMNVRGYPYLVQWALNLTKQLHQPPSEVEVVISNGSTHAISIVLSLLLNPGDPLLVEEYTWSHALENIFQPPRYDVIPVKMDEAGLDPESLSQVLEDRKAAGKPPPRVLYTVPTAQNPTSTTISWERKQQVYEVCRQHGVIILEDDAYFWLHFPKGPSHPPGLDLPRGYLGLDTDGRVVRVDTFAKLLGPGFRLGWISGSPKLIAKAALAISAATVGPNSISQVVVAEMLKKWGDTGFSSFVTGLQQRYGRLAAVAHAAAVQHMSGLATWVEPTAGMFMWVQLTDVEDAATVTPALVAAGVAVVPGDIFSVHSVRDTAVKCPFIRISFAGPTEEQLQLGFQRMGAAIRAHRGG